MIFRGKVYDIGSYMKFHPGGADILMKAAGKDGTALFMKYHPWVAIDALMEKHVVGLIAVDTPQQPTPSAQSGQIQTDSAPGAKARSEVDDSKEQAPAPTATSTLPNAPLPQGPKQQDAAVDKEHNQPQADVPSEIGGTAQTDFSPQIIRKEAGGTSANQAEDQLEQVEGGMRVK